MRIADIKAGQRDISIEGNVMSKESIYTKDASKDIIVQNFRIKDDSGEIGVAVWGSDKTKISDKAQEGDTIKIVKGNATETTRFGLKLNVGRDATINVVSKDVSLDSLLTPEEKRILVQFVKKLKELM